MAKLHQALLATYRERFSFTFVGEGVIDAAGSTRTVSGISFPDPAASREAVLVLSWAFSTARTLGSVTINGVSADIIGQINTLSDGHAFVQAPLPNGTTIEVIATFSGSVNNLAVAAFRMVGHTSRLPHDLDMGSGGGSHNEKSATLDIPANGVALANSLRAGVGSNTWTNAIAVDDQSATGLAAYQALKSTDVALAAYAIYNSSSRGVAAVSWS